MCTIGQVHIQYRISTCVLQDRYLCTTGQVHIQYRKSTCALEDQSLYGRGLVQVPYKTSTCALQDYKYKYTTSRGHYLVSPNVRAFLLMSGDKPELIVAGLLSPETVCICCGRLANAWRPHQRAGLFQCGAPPRTC